MPKPKVNVPTCTNCGTADPPHRCGRCHVSLYCTRGCQRQHWPDHKDRCVPPADRRPCTAAAVSLPCSICLEELTSPQCTLPCEHTFHKDCVDGIRKFGVSKVCPLCRADLPPGAEKLFDQAIRQFGIIARKVASRTTPALLEEDQRSMDIILQLLREAAAQGHASAHNTIGHMYAHGYGVAKDGEHAMQWYLKSADLGHEIAMFNVGVAYETGNGVQRDYAEALAWWHKAADKGMAEAKYNIGVFYLEGKGVAVDYVEAMRWLRMTEELPNAQQNIGLMYMEGYGVERDTEEAMRWLRIAADQGSVNAQFNIGLVYLIAKNLKETLRWFRKAADQGCPDAQHNLGVMCLFGDGVPKNLKEALRWLRLAAAQGYAPSQAVLDDL